MCVPWFLKTLRSSRAKFLISTSQILHLTQMSSRRMLPSGKIQLCCRFSVLLSLHEAVRSVSQSTTGSRPSSLLLNKLIGAFNPRFRSSLRATRLLTTVLLLWGKREPPYVSLNVAFTTPPVTSVALRGQALRQGASGG